MDNLRILLTSLVVLHHVAATYVGSTDWYYNEKPSSAASGICLGVFLYVNQAWFMGAFFLLSGYFTPGSYDRKGPRAFLRDRVIRLGIPLVVFSVVLNPVLCLPLVLDGADPGGPPPTAYLDTVGPGPLWFVLALLVLDVSYAAVRAVTGRSAARPRSPGRLTRRRVLAFALVLALVTYAWRMVVPMGYWVPIVDFPSGDYLPQYVSFFVLGTVAFRRGWFQALTGRMRAAGVALAVGASLTFLPLALGSGLDVSAGHGTLGSLCYALWDSCFAVGVVLALLAVLRRRFDSTGRLRRYLSAHAFTVYVTHAVVVTGAGYALQNVDLPTPGKVAVAAAVSLPASYFVAGPVRRLPGVRRVL